MKKISFNEIMSSVGDRHIEEASDFVPKHSKKIRWIALAACLAIIVTAVPFAIISNKEETNDDEIVFYISNMGTSNKVYNVVGHVVNLEFKDREVVIKDINEFQNYSQAIVTPSETIILKANAPSELKFTAGGISVCAALESVYYTEGTDEITDQALIANNKIAEYIITSINGKKVDVYDGVTKTYASLHYNITAKEIVRFYTWAVPQETEADLTEEEILETAKKDAQNLYGEDFLSKYSLSEIHSTFHPDKTSKEGEYSIRFDREIRGIKCDENVTFHYNGYGQLYKIRSHNLNSFDHVESKLTKKVLKKVEENALKLINGESIYHKYLAFAANGDVYVHYNYSAKEEIDGKLENIDYHLRIKVNY